MTKAAIVASFAFALSACRGGLGLASTGVVVVDAGSCSGLGLGCYDGLVIDPTCAPGVPVFRQTRTGCEVVRCLGEQFPLADGGCLTADCTWSDDGGGVSCDPEVSCAMMPRREGCR